MPNADDAVIRPITPSDLDPSRIAIKNTNEPKPKFIDQVWRKRVGFTEGKPAGIVKLRSRTKSGWQRRQARRCDGISFTKAETTKQLILLAQKPVHANVEVVVVLALNPLGNVIALDLRTVVWQWKGVQVVLADPVDPG